MTSGAFLPYGRQDIDESDIAAVAEALRSDFLTTGPGVEAFEEVERPVGVLTSARVVARRDDVIAVLDRLAQKDAELHLAIADDVGVRGQALAVAVDEVLDDRVAVVLDEVDDPEG